MCPCAYLLQEHMQSRVAAGAGEELWILKTAQHLGESTAVFFIEPHISNCFNLPPIFPHSWCLNIVFSSVLDVKLKFCCPFKNWSF